MFDDKMHCVTINNEMSIRIIQHILFLGSLKPFPCFIPSCFLERQVFKVAGVF